MTHKGLIIRHLAVTEPDVGPASLDFQPGLNLIYGASNTGKSFTLKSLILSLEVQSRYLSLKNARGTKEFDSNIYPEGVGSFTLLEQSAVANINYMIVS